MNLRSRKPTCVHLACSLIIATTHGGIWQPSNPHPIRLSQEGENIYPRFGEHIDLRQSPEFTERAPLIRSSIIIAIIMLLKAHLKTLYGISEE